MTAQQGAMYGVVGGFPLMMEDGMGTKTLYVMMGGNEEAVDLTEQMSQPVEQYRIVDFQMAEHLPILRAVFYDTLGTLKRMRKFIETELTRFAQMGLNAEICCAHCGKPIAGAPSILKVNDLPVPLHPACVTPLEMSLQEQEQLKRTEPREPGGGLRVLTGFAGALLGALVAGIPWVGAYVAGYFASILGMLIALGANLGHKLFGGRPGRSRVASVVVAVLLGVLAAQVAGEVGSLAWTIVSGEMDELLEVAPGTITLEQDLMPMLEILRQDPEYLGECVKNLLMGYLFAGLGLAAVYSSKLKRENGTGRLKLKRME